MNIKMIIRKRKIDRLINSSSLSDNEKELIDFLDYWFKSCEFKKDLKVKINNKYSYFYDSESETFYYDYDNIYLVLSSNFNLNYSDIQIIIKDYVVETFHAEVKNTRLMMAFVKSRVVETFHAEVKNTLLRIDPFVFRSC